MRIQPLHTPGPQLTGTPALSSIEILDAFTTPPPPLDFVLPGLLASTVGAVVSPGGTGKSMLALEIAVAIAGGVDLTNGAFAMAASGPVAYLAAEDPQQVLFHRLHAIGQYLPPEAREAVADGLTIVPLVGAPPQLLTPQGRVNSQGRDSMLRWANGQRLLLIDTLRRFHNGDENDSSAASELMSVLEHVAATTGTTILYLHHSSKFAILNGRTDEASASRGSSVFVDHPRWMAALVGMTQKEAEKCGIEPSERWRFVRLTHPKCNYAPIPPETWLHRTAGGVLVRADLPLSRTTARAHSRRQACDE